MENHKSIFEYSYGEVVEVIDLTKNIALLKQYIKCFNRELENHVKFAKSEDWGDYNWYYDQLEAFKRFHPGFGPNPLTSKEWDILSSISLAHA